MLSFCVPSAAAKETLVRPLPWLGFGGEGGLIILEELPDFEPPEGVDYRDFAGPALEAWLGAGARVVAVEPGAWDVFFVRGAPRPGPPDARVGRRFEVFGQTEHCTVEVTGAMHAVLSFMEGFGEESDGSPSKVYEGPGSRGTPFVPPVVEDEDDYRIEPEVVPPDELESNYDTSHRFVGLVARPVSGTCPLDGLVGAPGQLVRAPMRPGDAALADAVRQQFRGNRWIKKITREYLTETKLYPSALADQECPLKQVPKFLDAFATGLTTTVIEPEGARRYLIAATGDLRYPCDPSRAAIGYTQVKNGWKQSHELWGDAVYPLKIQFVVHDPKTKLLWAWGPPSRPGSAGWEWVVTALNKAGQRRRYGGWPDPAAHFCNYASTPWEYAQVCRPSDQGRSDDE